MKNASLIVIVLVAACSKKSPDAAANRKPVEAPAAAPAKVEDLCDTACTDLAVCQERAFPGESARDGGGCVDQCLAKDSATRTAWAADIAKALRTNDCARLFAETTEEEQELADDAGGDHEPVSIPYGQVQLGCVGWSEAEKAFGCVVGRRDMTGASVKLAFVGAMKRDMSLVETNDNVDGKLVELSATVAAKADTELARGGFRPIPAAFKPLAANKTMEVDGMSITFRGGKVVAKCSGRALDVFDLDTDGTTIEVSTRTVGAYTLVEARVDTAREGEYGDALEAAAIERASCAVSKSS